MLSGLKDVDREILKHVEDKDLIKACSLNRKAWNEVCDYNFLKRRMSKYPGVEKYKKEDESWKEFFLRFIYYTAKMRENHQIEYKTGDFEMQAYLLTTGANSMLLSAVSYNYLDIVKYAVKKGASFPTKSEALITSTNNGYYDIVKFLIEAGANVHFDHDLALRNAADVGHTPVVKLLIESGADVRALEDQVLLSAGRNGNLEIVKLLVQAGADVNSNEGKPLKFAKSRGYRKVVQYLLEHGAVKK